MKVRDNFHAFWRAVLTGSLIGGLGAIWFPLISSLLSERGWNELAQLSPSDFGAFFSLLLLSVVIAFCIVFLSSLVIGLPAHFVLRKLNRESAALYAAIGAASGLGLAALADLSDLPTLLVLSAMSGGCTGWTWGFERAAMIRDADGGYSPLI
ncbi:MAG: hypothetical protein ACKOQM_06735 [Novosphingobium sp.]